MTPRTKQQNKAMHKYFQLLADELDRAGYSPRELSGEVSIPSTPDMVEKFLWRPNNPRETPSEEMKQAFKFIARIFNEFGVDFRFALEDSIELEWTPRIVKECVWRPVQIDKLDKQSTTELNKDEVTKVYDHLEGNDEKGLPGLLRTKFPEADPVDFPNRDEDDIDANYPEPDIEPDDIPF